MFAIDYPFCVTSLPANKILKLNKTDKKVFTYFFIKKAGRKKTDDAGELTTWPSVHFWGH